MKSFTDKKKNDEDIERAAIIKIVVLVIVIVLYVFISNNIYSINFVSGNSMSPYVSNEGIVIAKRHHVEIERYDVVLAKVPIAKENNDGSIFELVKIEHQLAVKRVIGMPNDKIKIENGSIYVNGEQIEEYNYDTERSGIATEEITLDENEYFLMGDNRIISHDSRDYGPVTIDQVEGIISSVLYKGRD